MLIPIVISVLLIIIYVVIQLTKPYKFRIVEYANRPYPFWVERQDKVFKYWWPYLYQWSTGKIEEADDTVLQYRTLDGAQQCLKDYSKYLLNRDIKIKKIYKVEYTTED